MNADDPRRTEVAELARLLPARPNATFRPAASRPSRST